MVRWIRNDFIIIMDLFLSFSLIGRIITLIMVNNHKIYKLISKNPHYYENMIESTI